MSTKTKRTAWKVGDKVRAFGSRVFPSLSAALQVLKTSSYKNLVFDGEVVQVDKGLYTMRWNVNGSPYENGSKHQQGYFDDGPGEDVPTTAVSEVGDDPFSDADSIGDEDAESEEEEEEEDASTPQTLGSGTTTASVTTAPDSDLTVHGTVWRVAEVASIHAADAFQASKIGNTHVTPKRSSSLGGSEPGMEKNFDELQCLDHFLPPDFVQWVVDRASVSHHDVYLFLMEYVACSWYSGGSRRDLFRKSLDNDPLGLLPTPHLDRFLSRSIFEKILSSFDVEVVGLDMWAGLRPLVGMFRDYFNARITAGSTVVVDESFCATEMAETPSWALKAGFIIPDTSAPLQKNPEKPKGVGHEFYTSCTVSTDGQALMIGMEPVGSTAKDFTKDYGAITAAVLRIVEPYFNTWRVVIADSRFASFELAVALLERGLYFCGVVKNNTRSYPKVFLHRRIATMKKGEWVTAVTDVVLGRKSFSVTATCWRFRSKHKKCKFTMIATGIPTTAGPPVTKKRFDREKNAWQKYTLACPGVVRLYLDHHHYVDQHNMVRQFVLGLEVAHRTSSHGRRLFSFLLGCTVANAWAFWRSQGSTRDSRCDTSVRGFTHSLITKYFVHHLETTTSASGKTTRSTDPRPATTTPRSASPRPQPHSTTSSSSSTTSRLNTVVTRDAKRSKLIDYAEQVNDLLLQGHALVQISLVMGMGGREGPAQRRCRVAGCHDKTSYFCLGCSNVASNELFPVCKYNVQDEEACGCYVKHAVE
jgi:hypothetical protein